MANVRVAEQCILLIRVEQREVLHNDSHEKIQHDVSDDDVERAEVEQRSGRVAAVTLPVGCTTCTSRWDHHAVMHDLIPILAGDDTHEKNNGVGHRLEIRMAKTTGRIGVEPIGRQPTVPVQDRI